MGILSKARTVTATYPDQGVVRNTASDPQHAERLKERMQRQHPEATVTIGPLRDNNR